MKYEGLSKKQRDAAYQKWLESGPVPYGYHEHIFDMAKEDGIKRGFFIDGIDYSGFWSQGDGASWLGHVDLGIFVEYYREREDNPLTPQQTLILITAVTEDIVEKRVPVGNRGHYSHSGYMQFSDGVLLYSATYEEVKTGIFMGMPSTAFYEILDAELGGIEKAVLKTAREYADDIYKQLEKEYEHLSSEEAFKEHCESNDVTFNEEGEME